MTDMGVGQDRTQPYRQVASAVLAGLGTDPQRGLSAEARRRLSRHGRNELAGEKPVPGWRKFLAQFQDMLVILLLAAALASAMLWLLERDAALPYAEDGRWVVQGDPTEGALIVAARKAGWRTGRRRPASPASGRCPSPPSASS